MLRIPFPRSLGLLKLPLNAGVVHEHRVRNGMKRWGIDPVKRSGGLNFKTSALELILAQRIKECEEGPAKASGLRN